jgi:multidrug resistance efflux pump
MFLVLALGAGSALAYSLRCPRYPQCAGSLSARTTYVIADREGTLSDFLVESGAQIGLNQPLLHLVDPALLAEIQRKQREIATLESECERQLAEYELELDWRMRTINAEICEVQLKSASFLKEQYNHELRRTMLADVLQGDSFVMHEGADALFESLVLGRHLPGPQRTSTMIELEAAANNAEVSQAQVEICDQQIKFLKELRDKLPEQIRRSAGVEVGQARLAQAREELQLLQQQSERLTLVSPAIGQVGVFQVRRGDHIRVGTPIVELLDSSQRYVIAEVPSQQIVNYTIDARVTLTFPGQQLREGRVYAIAPQSQPQAESTLRAGDSQIAVHIEQVGEVWPEVPIGSRVMVQRQD